MVQVIQTGNPQGKIAEMLGMSLGQGLGSGINTYYANKALEDVINDKSLENKPISAKMGKLQSALAPYGDTGKEIFNQRMQIEQQDYAEKKQAELFKHQKELKSIQTKQERQRREENAPGFKKALIANGFSEEDAEAETQLYLNSPVGGQTEQLKRINDTIHRNKGRNEKNPEQKETTKPAIQIPGIGDESLELDFPDLPESVGLKPSDEVKRNEYREKVNSPLYAETVDRLNALDDEYRDITYLQELDQDPEKLPSGIEKWNVDWDTGDLRAKALATPQAQAYVKTIARMARKAKEFFPGRVTNFDLEQFKAGFGTLANSHEGRQLINQQLATANRIAYLKDETLKAAIDHYGSGADPVLIKKYATENYRKLKGQLEKKLQGINEQADQMISQSEKHFMREKVPQGTKGDVSIIDKYLKANNFDPVAAEKQAREDGYDF
jgi:hypothetical protein